MKKVLNLLVLLISIICFSGCSCNKLNFAFFKDKVNDIDGYRYYVITQEIYNEELLLYKEEKNVYLNDEKYRIVVNTSIIADLESENLYDETEEVYYQSGDDFYYQENGKWKTKQKENSSENIGVSISEEIFKSYSIKEEGGNKFLEGTLKDNSLDDFFGFDIEDVSDVKLSIEISNTDKVKNISIQYNAENGNRVVVSIKVGYTQVIKFSLPTVE